MMRTLLICLILIGISQSFIFNKLQSKRINHLLVKPDKSSTFFAEEIDMTGDLDDYDDDDEGGGFEFNKKPKDILHNE